MLHIIKEKHPSKDIKENPRTIKQLKKFFFPLRPGDCKLSTPSSRKFNCISADPLQFFEILKLPFLHFVAFALQVL